MSQGGDNEVGWARHYAWEEARKMYDHPRLPFSLICELLETRTKDAVRSEPVYVEDELYELYERGIVGQSYKAVEHPEPNLLFHNVVIRPMSSKKVCKECGRPL